MQFDYDKKNVPRVVRVVVIVAAVYSLGKMFDSFAKLWLTSMNEWQTGIKISAAAFAASASASNAAVAAADYVAAVVAAAAAVAAFDAAIAASAVS